MSQTSIVSLASFEEPVFNNPISCQLKPAFLLQEPYPNPLPIEEECQQWEPLPSLPRLKSEEFVWRFKDRRFFQEPPSQLERKLTVSKTESLPEPVREAHGTLPLALPLQVTDANTAKQQALTQESFLEEVPDNSEWIPPSNVCSALPTLKQEKLQMLSSPAMTLVPNYVSKSVRRGVHGYKKVSRKHTPGKKPKLKIKWTLFCAHCKEVFSARPTPKNSRYVVNHICSMNRNKRKQFVIGVKTRNCKREHAGPCMQQLTKRVRET